MKPYKVRVKIVSPLHIGTGEVYEPTDFFVDQANKELCVLDFDRLCEYLSGSELEQFKKLCIAGTLESLVRLYDFMDRVCLNLLRQGIDGFIKRRVMLCAGFIEHYQRVKTLSGQQLRREFNRFIINRTAFSPNEGFPIIPGSAIKGAIRTAVLNLRRSLARHRSWHAYCDRRRCDSKQLESEILRYPKNRFNQDPFRLVKVSDFKPVGKVNTRIVYAVNRKKGGGRARGPYQILEVVEPGAVFEGTITLLKLETSTHSSLNFEELLNALNAFYAKEKDREFDEISQIGANPPVFPEGAFPLRIGRHSGAECVTIKDFRRILIRGPRGQKSYKDHATTLWLASDFAHVKNAFGLKPFGWAVLYDASSKLKEAPNTKSEAKPAAIDTSKLAKRYKIVIRKNR